MVNRTYPREKDSDYPEIMSKMDPLIIRVSPTVLLVGATTYTAKVKIGYKFNGFMVYVSSVGIPIYQEEVDITGLSKEGTNNVGEGSDAYNYIKDKARDWMDTLEQSMLADSKEKNIVDLLREIKYQMHFDASGHKYPAIIEPGQPGYDPEQYDSRMEVCTEVPTYIEDLYAMLLKISIRLDNLTAVINGGDLKELHGDSVVYNQQTGKFNYSEDTIQSSVTGLNERIDDLNKSIGTSKDDAQGGKSLQSRITEIQESIGNGTDADHTSLQDMIFNNTLQLIAIQSSIGPGTGGGQGGASLQAKIDTVASDIAALSTQSGTNATTISNAITNGLNQLVAKMNDMNSRIGTSSDPVGTATLFGQIGTTNNRIGTPQNNDTLFSLDYDIKSAPILGSDVTNDTITNLNIVLSYLNASTNDANVRGDDTYIKALNRTSYNMVCWRGMDGNANTTLSEALYYSMRYDYSPYDYYSGPTAQERGYTQITSGKMWGIRITSAKP